MITVCLSLCACGTDSSVPDAVNSYDESALRTEPSAQPSEADASGDSQKTPAADEDNVSEESASADVAQSSTILTAYFSATGTTKGVAEKIAEAADADLYEIVPAVPYTDDDLNYNSDSSRTTEEQNDDNSRPEIAGEVPNWDDYTIVCLGYPIWWGEAPRIMDTFVESYNFEGKTVIPFCTSGSSGVGSSAKNLKALSNGGVWEDGARFNGSVSEEEIEEWVSETLHE